MGIDHREKLPAEQAQSDTLRKASSAQMGRMATHHGVLIGNNGVSGDFAT